MPGNNTFVAGFTQCEFGYRITGVHSGVCAHPWTSQCGGYQSEYFRSRLPKSRKAVQRSAVRFLNLNLWEQNSGLYRTVRVHPRYMHQPLIRADPFGNRGPGFRISDFESNRIIGQVQFEGAKTLMSRSLTPVSGPVKRVHTYVNMYVPSPVRPVFPTATTLSLFQSGM